MRAHAPTRCEQYSQLVLVRSRPNTSVSSPTIISHDSEHANSKCATFGKSLHAKQLILIGPHSNVCVRLRELISTTERRRYRWERNLILTITISAFHPRF